MVQLKDVIQYFIGCDVIVDGKERGKLIGADLVPNSVNQIYYNIQTDKMREEDGEDFCMPYNDDVDDEPRIKPILRKLEDITDEEIKELIGWEKMNAMYTDLRYKVHPGTCINIEYSIDTGDEGVYPQFHSISFQTPAIPHFLFLLKKKFDLFQLIPTGQAVDEKEISQIEK